MLSKRFAVAAACLAIASAMSAGCAASYSSEIDSIMAGDTLNQMSADSAPQQSVVNGWTARDFLELSARQNIESTYLLYGLLIVGVLVIVLLFVLVRRMSRLEAALTRQTPEWSEPIAADPTPPLG